MGCDIHAYIDYDLRQQAKMVGLDEAGKLRLEKQYHDDGTPLYIVDAFAKRIDIDRFYLLFAILADTRNYWGVDIPYPPRGIPGDVSSLTADEYYLWVGDGNEQYDTPEWQGWCSRESADRYVAGGHSHGVHYRTEERQQVQHPDWHSASWLTADELQTVYDQYKQGCADLWPDDEFHPTPIPAVIAAMRALDACVCQDGGKSRFVFWFDN